MTVPQPGSFAGCCCFSCWPTFVVKRDTRYTVHELVKNISINICQQLINFAVAVAVSLVVVIVVVVVVVVLVVLVVR